MLDCRSSDEEFKSPTPRPSSLPVNGGFVPPTHVASIQNDSRMALLTDVQGGGLVYTPTGWQFDLDVDGDGVLDSCSRLYRTGGPYNQGDPYRHMDGANVAFVDGHVAWVSSRSWLTDVHRLWAGRDTE